MGEIINDASVINNVIEDNDLSYEMEEMEEMEEIIENKEEEGEEEEEELVDALCDELIDTLGYELINALGDPLVSDYLGDELVVMIYPKAENIPETHEETPEENSENIPEEGEGTYLIHFPNNIFEPNAQTLTEVVEDSFEQRFITRVKAWWEKLKMF